MYLYVCVYIIAMQVVQQYKLYVMLQWYYNYIIIVLYVRTYTAQPEDTCMYVRTYTKHGTQPLCFKIYTCCLDLQYIL